ncbi:MAG: hypothetical protein VCF24_09385 [Candidatus Latescibacterota bacterium]
MSSRCIATNWATDTSGTDRDGNSNIEEGLLSEWLIETGYTPPQISVALQGIES